MTRTIGVIPAGVIQCHATGFGLCGQIVTSDEPRTPRARPLPGEPDRLYRNTGRGTFVDVTKRAGIIDPGHYGFSVLFSDLDDDGWPDIYVANDSTPNLFFRNQRDGTFVEQALQSGLAVTADGREQAGMGVDAGDYDGGHWITLRLEGTVSNRSAIGAKVTVEAAGRRRMAEVRSGGSYVSQNDARVHFGLGPATTVAGVSIRWPNGKVETATALAADRFYVAREGTGVRPGK